jgi:hypothetical protein
MDISNVLILVFIGTLACMLSGFMGALAGCHCCKAGEINFTYAEIAAPNFSHGGCLGLKPSLRLLPSTVNLFFGILPLYSATGMIDGFYKFILNEL